MALRVTKKNQATEETQAPTSTAQKAHEEQKLVELGDTKKKVEEATVEANRKLEELSESILIGEGNLETLENNKLALEVEIAELETDRDEEKKALEAAKGATTMIIEEQEKEIENLLKNKKDNIVSLEVRLGSLLSDKKRIEDEIVVATNKVKELKVQIETYNTAVSDTNALVINLEAKVIELNNSINEKQMLNSSIGDRTGELEALSIAIEEKSKDLVSIQNKIETAKQTYRDVLSSSETRVSEVDEKIRVLNLLEETVDAKTDKLKQLFDRATVAGLIKDKIL